jgi:hypothetical protein
MSPTMFELYKDIPIYKNPPAMFATGNSPPLPDYYAIVENKTVQGDLNHVRQKIDELLQEKTDA